VSPPCRHAAEFRNPPPYRSRRWGVAECRVSIGRVGTQMEERPAIGQVNVRPEIVQIKAEHRALAILRFLHHEPSYSSNERIIAAYLDLLALGGVSAEVRSALDALERLALVRAESREGLIVVRLTQVGEDVALGRAIVEGVLRPALKEPY
jgi:hypothetical protein